MSSAPWKTIVIQSTGYLLIFFDGVALQESTGRRELILRIDVSNEEIYARDLWFEF